MSSEHSSAGATGWPRYVLVAVLCLLGVILLAHGVVGQGGETTGQQGTEDVLIVGLGDGTLLATDPQTGEERWNLTYSSRIVALERSPDGDEVYAGFSDGFVRAIDVEEETAVWNLSEPVGSIRDVSVAPNGEVYAGTFDGDVLRIDQNDGERLWTQEQHRGSISSVATAARDDDNALYSNSFPGRELAGNNRATGDEVWDWLMPTERQLTRIVLPEHGSVTYAGTDRGTIEQFTTSTREQNWEASVPNPAFITAIDHIEARDELLVANEDGVVYRFDPQSQSAVWSNNRGGEQVDDISYTTDGNTVYVVHEEQVRGLQYDDGTETVSHQYDVDVRAITHVQTDADEQIEGDGDESNDEPITSLQGTIQTEAGDPIADEPVFLYDQNANELEPVDLDNDASFTIEDRTGSFVIVADGDAGLPPEPVEVESDEQVTVDLVRSTPGMAATDLSTTAEDGTLMTGDADGYELIDADTGRWFHTVEPGPGSTVAFGTDWTTLFEATDDGEIRQRDTITGEQRWAVDVSAAPLQSVVRLDDGVAVVDVEGMVAIVDADGDVTETATPGEGEPVGLHPLGSADRAAVTFEDGTVAWIGNEQSTIQLDDEPRASGAAFDSSVVVVATESTVFTVGPDGDRAELGSLDVTPEAVAASPDGQTAYVGTDEGEVVAIDRLTGHQTWSALPGDSVIEHLRYAGESTLYATTADTTTALDVSFGTSQWTREAGGQEMTLQSNATGGLGTLDGSIEGNVTYSEVSVTVETENRSLSLSPTDEGEFATQLAPGEYDLAVTGDGLDESRTVSIESGGVGEITIDASPDQIPIEFDGSLVIGVLFVIGLLILGVRHFRGGDDVDLEQQIKEHNASQDAPGSTATANTETQTDQSTAGGGNVDGGTDAGQTMTAEDPASTEEPATAEGSPSDDMGPVDQPTAEDDGATGRPELDDTEDGGGMENSPAAGDTTNEAMADESSSGQPPGATDDKQADSSNTFADDSQGSQPADSSGGQPSHDSSDQPSGIGGTPPAADPFSPESLSYTTISAMASSQYTQSYEATLTDSVLGNDTVEVITVTDAVDEGGVEAFNQAVRDWNSVSTHDNVRQALDFGSNPRPWVAVEPEEHTKLENKQQHFDTDDGVAIAGGLCRGLRHASLYNVSHTQLAPNCITVDDGPPAKGVISNWGLENTIVEFVEGPDALLPYRAPEQLDQSHGSIGPHTDVYLVGVIGYELLTGVPLVQSRSNDRLREAILSGTFEPPSEHNGQLPATIDMAFEQALATEPHERYDSIQQFRLSLEDAIR